MHPKEPARYPNGFCVQPAISLDGYGDGIPGTAGYCLQNFLFCRWIGKALLPGVKATAHEPHSLCLVEKLGTRRITPESLGILPRNELPYLPLHLVAFFLPCLCDSGFYEFLNQFFFGHGFKFFQARRRRVRGWRSDRALRILLRWKLLRVPVHSHVITGSLATDAVLFCSLITTDFITS